MTEEQFREACWRTAELLMRTFPDTPALRQEGGECRPGHLLWMLLEAQGFYAANKVEKANRWLGFVQGAMAAHGYATVAELKKANMPEGESFDPKRI